MLNNPSLQAMPSSVDIVGEFGPLSHAGSDGVAIRNGKMNGAHNPQNQIKPPFVDTQAASTMPFDQNMINSPHADDNNQDPRSPMVPGIPGIDMNPQMPGMGSGRNLATMGSGRNVYVVHNYYGGMNNHNFNNSADQNSHHNGY